MKRLAKNLVYSVKKYYSLFFWKQCHKCKLEFRRSKGWKCKSRSLTIYLCSSCFPKKGKINLYITEITKKSIEEKRNYILT